MGAATVFLDVSAEHVLEQKELLGPLVSWGQKRIAQKPKATVIWKNQVSRLDLYSPAKIPDPRAQYFS